VESGFISQEGPIELIPAGYTNRQTGTVPAILQVINMDLDQAFMVLRFV
jgi:hypothetical protein